MRSGSIATALQLGDRGNVAVVRRGTSLPSSQSGAVPLELSSPECGTVVGIILPPDVRLAGRPCTKRAHLGSQVRKPLTEKSSCEAGHMKATYQTRPDKMPLPRGRPHMNQISWLKGILTILPDRIML